MDYPEFLESKRQSDSLHGFDPVFMPDWLFDFQKCLASRAVRKGRSAVFSHCGTGKSPIEFVWCENVVRETNRPVLLLTPLGVVGQMLREAEKFGIEAVRGIDGKFPPGARIVVTNYDQLHKYNPDDFAGCACDESSVIKHFDARRTAVVTEFLRTLPYRLLCTATPAPNDFDELGTSAEVLGEMGHRDMITKFFTRRFVSDYRGWNREKYDLKGHAERDFWRWVCSWARACRKPSDLGPFDDSKYILPPLETRQHVVSPLEKRSGFLFDVPAETLAEQCEERRRSIGERCEKVAELVCDTGRPAVCWCHLNDEGDLITKLVPGAVQVSGSDPDELKELKFLAFASGEIRVLITKPVIAAWGLNWQHCAHQTFFPSHSFEMFFQAIHRSLRFCQANTVGIDVVCSEGETPVVENLWRKWASADRMLGNLVRLMNDPLSIDRGGSFTTEMEFPSWLSREVYA